MVRVLIGRYKFFKAFSEVTQMKIFDLFEKKTYKAVRL
jgi:hypothetical protein